MLDYAVFLLIICGIYALLSLSLCLSWGTAGLVNLGIVGFYAIGAYVSALLTRDAGVSMGVGFLAAVAAGAVAGLVVAFSTLRLRHEYLAIITLGFSELIRLVSSNEIWLTGGTDGISGITGGVPRQWGLGFGLSWLAIVTVLVIATYLLFQRLTASPWGRVLRAIREDDVVAAVAGKPVVRFKAEAFAFATAIAALAGAIQGHYGSYVAPEMFQPLTAIYVFLALTMGGNGRPAGAVLGAYILIILLEALRFAVEVIPDISALQAAALREASVGVALVLLLRFRSRGLLPELNQKAPSHAHR